MRKIPLSLISVLSIMLISSANAGPENIIAFGYSGGGGGGAGGNVGNTSTYAGGDGGILPGYAGYFAPAGSNGNKGGNGGPGSLGFFSGGGGGGGAWGPIGTVAGSDGDDVGAGGSANTSAISPTGMTDAVAGLNGAVGGDGGNGGKGVDFSNVTETFSSSNSTFGSIIVIAGNGGNGGAGSVVSGVGGAGGAGSSIKVDLTASEATADKLVVRPGTYGRKGDGTNGGAAGAGGQVEFSAGTFSAPEIIVSGRTYTGDPNPVYGKIKFYIDNLKVNQDTSITLDDTLNSSIDIRGLEISGGSTLTYNYINGAQFNYIGGHIKISGKNNKVVGIAGVNNTNRNLIIDLPSDITNGDVLLTFTNGNGLRINEDSDIVFNDGAMALTNLNKGDMFSLVSGRVTLSDETKTMKFDGQIRSAIYGATQYDFTMSWDANGVYAKYGEADPIVPVDPNIGKFAKSYTESSMATLGQLNTAADSVLNQILASSSGASGVQSFAELGGSKLRMNSGSYVDVLGLNFLGGVSNKTSDATYGAFAQVGTGSYDSFNDFGTKNVRGNGNTYYYGVGAFGQYDIDQEIYVDGSLSLGYTTTDYTSDDLTGAEFNTGALYTGAHVGSGYKYQIAEDGVINPYAQIVWGYVGGDTVNPIAAETVTMDALNSIRSRVGVRYVHNVDTSWDFIGGIAWENEFAGKQTGTYESLGVVHDIEAPSVAGGSYMFELGGTYTTQSDWAFGANVKAITGVREGFAGGINAKYKF